MTLYAPLLGQVCMVAALLATAHAGLAAPGAAGAATDTSAGSAALSAAAQSADHARTPVRLGVDVLRDERFARLAGMRIGLVTNHTGLDARGASTADLLASAPGVKLVRLFGPEHGVRGELDQAQIDDGVDGPTGLPVVSLYGPRRRPDPEHLADLDALVFDIQDIGCRFYTYVSTMKLVMLAASEAGLPLFVLDRPNPIGATAVEGPVLAGPPVWGGDESFVACHPIAVRHGMTVGELARLFAAEGPGGRPLPIDLRVVPCEGWGRGRRWDETGLVWTDPSPNMRRLTQAILYPGVGLLETTNLSVGRGTDTPFERIGAPWIEPSAFAAALRAECEAAGIEGVRFTPRYFTPTASTHQGQLCGGLDLAVTDADRLHAVRFGLAIARTLRRLYADDWDPSRYPRLLESPTVQTALVEGATTAELARLADEGLAEFLTRREAVLLYAE